KLRTGQSEEKQSEREANRVAKEKSRLRQTLEQKLQELQGARSRMKKHRTNKKRAVVDDDEKSDSEEDLVKPIPDPAQRKEPVDEDDSEEEEEPDHQPPLATERKFAAAQDRWKELNPQKTDKEMPTTNLDANFLGEDSDLTDEQLEWKRQIEADSLKPVNFYQALRS